LYPNSNWKNTAVKLNLPLENWKMQISKNQNADLELLNANLKKNANLEVETMHESGVTFALSLYNSSAPNIITL